MLRARSFVRSLVGLSLVVASGALASCDIHAASGTPSSDGSLTQVTIDGPIADTYVDQSNPDTNYGTATTMIVSGPAFGDPVPLRSALVRFDDERIVPSLEHRTVVSAQLTVWLQSPVSDMGCEFSYAINAMNRRWTETGATANSGATFACADQELSACAPGDVWDFSPGAASPPYHVPSTDTAGCSVVDGTTRLVFDVSPDLVDSTSDAIRYGWVISSVATRTHLATVDAMTSESARPARLEITLADDSYVPSEPLHAPPLDFTRPTSVFEATRFLYDPAFHASPSDDNVQWGMIPALIERDRAAVIHGRVLSIDGAALPATNVQIHGHPEFGQTRSRASGEFDLVVNGGGTLVLDYSLAAHLPAQRTVEVPWNSFARAPDVTLLDEPGVCSRSIDTSTAQFVFGHDSSNRWTTPPDARGTRSTAFFIPAGVRSEDVSDSARTFQICMAEYTRTPESVGPCDADASHPCADGFLCIAGDCVADPRSTMPADIAPGTSYTFANQACARESDSATCRSTRFRVGDTEGIIYRYVFVDRPADAASGRPADSFALRFEGGGVGLIVPSGSYDSASATWTAEADGYVFQVDRAAAQWPGCPLLGPTSMASLEQPSNDECALVASDTANFPDGTIFWRIPTRHFSETDDNWGSASGTYTQQGVASAGTVDQNDDCAPTASVISCESRSLGETIPVAGAGFSLAYFSGHQRGRIVENSVVVRPVPTPSEVSDSIRGNLQSIVTTVEVAGRPLRVAGGGAPRYSFTFTRDDIFGPTATPEQRFVWDGMDRFGRPTVGPQPGRVTMTFLVYAGQMRIPAGPENDRSFGAPYITVAQSSGGGGGPGFVSLPVPIPIAYTVTRDVIVGTVDDATQGLGGWNIDVHSTYSPVAHAIYGGTGDRRTVRASGNTLSYVQNTIQPCATGVSPGPNDRCGACSSGGIAPVAVAAAPDGAIFMAGGPSGAVRIWRVGRDHVRQDLGVSIPLYPRLAAARRRGAAGETSILYVGTTDCITRYRYETDHLEAEQSVGACGAAGTTDSMRAGHPLNVADHGIDVHVTPTSLDVGRDGSLFIADGGASSRLLRWRADGWIEDIVHMPGRARLLAVEATDAGPVYLGMTDPAGTPGTDRIMRMSLDGASDNLDCTSPLDCMTLVVGGRSGGSLADGIPGTELRLGQLGSNPVGSRDAANFGSDRAGRLYFTQRTASVDSGPRAGTIPGIWRLELDGRVTFMAGPRPLDFAGTPVCLNTTCPGILPLGSSSIPCDAALPATAADLGVRGSFFDLDVGPDDRVLIAMASGVLQVAPYLEGTIELDHHEVASEDGSVVYEFDPSGRHLRTVDYLTQRPIWSFTYDPVDGRLAGVTDVEGQTTTIDYGAEQIVLTAPGSLRTTLTTSGGYTQSVVDPESHEWVLRYHPILDGLLQQFREPGAVDPHLFFYDTIGQLQLDVGVADRTGGIRPTMTLDEPAPPSVDGIRTLTMTTEQGRRTTYEVGEAGWTHRRVRHAPTGYVDRIARPADGLRTLHAIELRDVRQPAEGCDRGNTSTRPCDPGSVCLVEASTTGGADHGICVPYLATIDTADHPDVLIGPDARYASRITVERRATNAAGTSEIVTSLYLRQRPPPDSCGALADTVTYPTPSGLASVTALSTHSTATTPLAVTWTTVTPHTDHSPRVVITRGSLGRVTCIETEGVQPTRVRYVGDSVRPASIAQGAFGAGCANDAPAQRQVAYTYPSDGTRWLTSVAVGAGAGPVLTRGITPIHGTGWTSEVHLPGSEGTIHVDYDARGNITHFTPPSAHVHSFSYTDRDLPDRDTPPSTATLSGDEVTQTEYTPDGQLSAVHLHDGTVIALGYDATRGTFHTLDVEDASPIHLTAETDAFGQVTSIIDAPRPGVQGVGMTLGYDLTIPRSATWSGPRGFAGSVTRTVGPAMTVDATTVSLTAAAGPAASASFAYAYDDDLVLTGTRLATDVNALTYTRNAYMRPPPESTPCAAATLAPPAARESLTVSMNQMRTHVGVSDLGELSLLMTAPQVDPSAPIDPNLIAYADEICAEGGRDGLGRVRYRIERVRRAGPAPRGAAHAQLDVIGYRYDYDGDRLRGYDRFALTDPSCTAFVASVGLRTDASATYTYTANGGVTSGTSAACPASQYDAADRPTCGGRQYDDRGQLTRRANDRARDPRHPTRAVEEHFQYDALGRLRSSTTIGGEATEYEWDPSGRLVGIHDAHHDEHFVYGDALGPIAWRRDGDTAFFAYGTQSHVPDAMWLDRGSEGHIDAAYRILTDERGSVRVVVRVDPGHEGEVEQRIDYDPWGVPTETGTARLQPLGFAGGIWLAGPGLWRFGARDYDPTIGSWTGGDPIGFAGGQNLFGYCGGDPVNCIDPRGLQTPEEVSILGGADYVSPLVAALASGQLEFVQMLTGAIPTPGLGEARQMGETMRRDSLGLSSPPHFVEMQFTAVRMRNPGWLDVVPIGSKAEVFRNAEHYWFARNEVASAHPRIAAQVTWSVLIAILYPAQKAVFDPLDMSSPGEVMCGLHGLWDE